MPIILVLGKLRLENHDFEDNLDSPTDRSTKVNILTNLTFLEKVQKAKWNCLRQSEWRDWDSGDRFLSQAEKNTKIFRGKKTICPR